jgi:hypothetical protein
MLQLYLPRVVAGGGGTTGIKQRVFVISTSDNWTGIKGIYNANNKPETISRRGKRKKQLILHRQKRARLSKDF